MSMPKVIESVTDLSDDEIVRIVESLQVGPGAYLNDPLEGPIVVITGKTCIPKPELFDDIRTQYHVIVSKRKS